jgi:hypothetical protein
MLVLVIHGMKGDIYNPKTRVLAVKIESSYHGDSSITMELREPSKAPSKSSNAVS